MYARILVHLDNSSASVRRMDEAVHLAARHKAALRFVYVVDGSKYACGACGMVSRDADLIPWMEKAGGQVLQQGRRRAGAAGVAAQTVLLTVQAAPVADIVMEQAQAWNADLLVTGARSGHLAPGQAPGKESPMPMLWPYPTHPGEAGVEPAKTCVAVAA
ncbi:nucleotide-binding universal stress UspA family protein [Variovorax boronicumulans]|uniref:universal stress protein n=1 Tax=Variovorax boronicumulans TaxID=436515 RepID=UPI003393FB93